MLGLLVLASAFALPFGDAHKVVIRDLWYTLWLVAVCFSYLAGCWYYGGMTVGMRAWKVALVSSDERQVSRMQCVLRFFAAVVSLAFFALGIVWALVDKKKRCWHDLAAGTVLINLGKRNG